MDNSLEVKFELKFLGAAETVSGSSYLMRVTNGQKVIATVMVDHGMFQGPEIESRNYDVYQFNPAEIDYLLVTHSHIDHIGLIPKLVRHGFSGKIIATKATAKLMELLLFDSAKVQSYKLRDEGITPIYDENDVYSTLELIEVVDFMEEIRLLVNGNDIDIKCVFYRAGHVLGAGSILLEIANKKIAFSGDIGRRTQDIIQGFNPIVKNADYVVMESLYGGKFHQEKTKMLEIFASKITSAISRNGNVIIPAFALQRTQELLFDLNYLVKSRQIPENVQIYLDSPLAQRINNVYTDYVGEVYSNNKRLPDKLSTYLYSTNVNIVKTASKSRKTKKKSGSIIISGSGMCNGGRVLGYLKSMITDSRNMLAIVGFQAEGTLGREIIEGAQQILIDNKYFRVRAEVNEFKGFSAHGDQQDLYDWLQSFDRGRLKRVFLVHAEIEQAESFSRFLETDGYVTQIPVHNEVVSL